MDTNGDLSEVMDQKLSYSILKAHLLAAAEDCDKRGHPRNISARFRDAASVCDTAGNTP